MIGELANYQEYKESDMPWARRVPAHWGKRRTKFLFRERVQKGFPDEPLLAATQNMGVVRKTDYGERTVTASKDLHLLKLVETGDFVISLRSFQGGLEIAHYRGIISPAYTILLPRPDAFRRYFRHFFKSPDFIRNLTLFVTGIREGQNIDYERLSRAYLPLPPVEEQELISRFLDHANGRLERAIRAKRKVIALLTEQKQAIIHRAVTRGLDPTVPLKPSGIPWLGDIPDHWKSYPARALFTEIKERGLINEMMLSVTIKRGVITQAELLDNSIKKDSSNEDKSKYKLLTLGDIAYNKMRAWQGAFGVSNYRGIISPAYVVIRPNEFAESSYYHHVFRIPAFAKEAESWSYGIASDMWSLRPEHFRLIQLPCPPIIEQAEIANFINTKLQRFDAAIDRLEREINLLREYRTRLVADVVTGQLDVRAAAARLPAEAPAVPPTPDEPLAELEEVEA
jgi:type I restriction enzyme S subunit